MISCVGIFAKLGWQVTYGAAVIDPLMVLIQLNRGTTIALL